MVRKAPETDVKKQEQSARDKRLAEALRANLRRRKQQQKQRQDDAEPKYEGDE